LLKTIKKLESAEENEGGGLETGLLGPSRTLSDELVSNNPEDYKQMLRITPEN
jgi:hypothetical protein